MSPSEDPAGEEATKKVTAEDGVVDGPQVASIVSRELAKIVGRAPESITCPDLKAKVGTQIRCRLTDSGQSYGVSVQATAVKGDDVSFSFRVDDRSE